jgi:drug/metabolite transporter (DMT)-like permease
MRVRADPSNAVKPSWALVLDREPISRRFLAALPVMIVGIVLTGGVLEAGTGGSDAVAGTVHAILAAVCYSGFLYLLRRGGGQGQVIQSYLVVVGTSAVVAVGAGPFWGSLTFTPGLGDLAWLVLIAAAGQVTGWLLVAIATPQLRPEVGAALLLLTPVGALVLGALALDERPSDLQLVGCVLVLASAYGASVRSRPGRDATDPEG